MVKDRTGQDRDGSPGSCLAGSGQTLGQAPGLFRLGSEGECTEGMGYVLGAWLRGHK